MHDCVDCESSGDRGPVGRDFGIGRDAKAQNAIDRGPGLIRAAVALGVTALVAELPQQVRPLTGYSIDGCTEEE